MIYARGDFISNKAWLESAVSNKELILRGVSALEYLDYFVGYLGETDIDVYAKSIPNDEHINFDIVDDFSQIDYNRYGGVLCSSFEQAINDLLADDNSDIQALTESLSNYYFEHNESFDGLIIYPENEKQFDEIKESAVNYYCWG